MIKIIITSAICILAVILLNGCAVPSGGCPYCGYPPGVLMDGSVVNCSRCGGTYRAYLDGSVAPLNRPAQLPIYPAPTNNTDATQRNLQQTGSLLLQGLKNQGH